MAGIEQVYVHVHRNNLPAQALYQKIGFEVMSTSGFKSFFIFVPFCFTLWSSHICYDFQVVEIASSQLVEEQTYLLCINTGKLNNVHLC